MEKTENINNSSKPDWMTIISRYNKPNALKSWWQVVNSMGPYIILWILMIKSIEISYWLTLLLSVFAAGFMVRIFIIFHDCGHGSFFKSKVLNRIVGIITGLIVFTPYNKWHHEHKIHHQTVGNLDKRGVGDVMTLTVDEYQKLSKWRKLYYRIYRNPVVLFGIAPIIIFTIAQRFPKKNMNLTEKLYVHLSSLALAAAVVALIFLIGWKTFLLVQIPILYIATAHGVWLFYVQHQFRDVLWSKAENWDYMNTALKGSSMFKLPFLLNWFTGNIGYHHIHHLSPMIPNYNLKKCHRENAIFQQVKPITFWSAFESALLKLYDEKSGRLVKFSEI
ncbi:MAG: fatty acid desaturase [Bacteroidales bacterium]|nr:fatty acid desaturase [Bacteroidales bacterium]